MRALIVAAILAALLPHTASAKPRPPLALTLVDRAPLPAKVRGARAARELTPNRDETIELLLVANQDVGAVQLRARGLEGVVVVGQSAYTIGDLAPGERRVLSLRVRAPEGVAGFVVLDVQALGAPSKARRAFSFSRPFAVRARGAARRLETIGERTVDGQGRAIVRMGAKER